MVFHRTTGVCSPLCPLDVDGVECLRHRYHSRPRGHERSRHRRCQNLLQRGKFVPSSPATSASFSAIMPEKGGRTPEFRTIRRDLDNAVIFFIANTERSASSVRITVPVSGQQPELWDPVWGTMRDLFAFEQTATATTLTVEFAPAQSFFLVFRRPVSRQSVPPNHSSTEASNTTELRLLT